ncbi:hypothetical protein FB451DRAFT_1366632 [Mycena latifolia]|nr:hypothetical protein FB451DRAFT_1366632 [Mycena latifolia]
MDHLMDDQDIQNANLAQEISIADHSGVVAKAPPQSVDVDPRCRIHTIPTELLSLVFKFVMENVDFETAIQVFNDLLSCAQTCGPWRSILLQSPSLWAELAVFSVQGMCGDFITAFGLANNASLALNAVIPFPLHIMSLPCGRTVVSSETDIEESARITEAVIRGLQHLGGFHSISIASNTFKELFPAMQEAAPELTSLTLECTTNRFLRSEDYSVHKEPFARGAPNLRHLHFEGFMNTWSSPLVQNLTTLHLSRSFDSVGGQPRLSTVLRALRTCPQLGVLHVTGCELPMNIDPESPAQISGMVVALPRLRRLELAGNASDMLGLVLNLGIPQALAGGISFTCGLNSLPEMVPDIFTYADDMHPGSSQDGSDRFGSLDIIAGSELKFRLLRGNIEITVFAPLSTVNPGVAGVVLHGLPLGSITELSVQCHPVFDRVISKSFWWELLKRLRTVERMVVPGQTVKELMTVLTVPQPNTLLPALRTLVLEGNCNANDGGLVDQCIASRKDADVVELEVQIKNDVEESGNYEEFFDEYLYQFVSEMGSRRRG